MTRYEKELIRMIGMRFGELTPQQLVEKLTRIGVIDITLCKVLTSGNSSPHCKRTG